jgi:crotonobetainyl-CoA:carnitine CoA-transferase CaiB-like acyl-CoA transferase
MSALGSLRILDLTRILAGPYCTQLLGDFGAQVIKIEQPDLGDGTRQWGPPWVGDQSAYFLSVNRNKRSVAVNLKTPEGQEIIRALAAQSDVLVENFMPGTLDSLGLGFEALRAINPQLIYCAITGYGQTGPYRDRPGYDFAIQAEGGVMSITGPADGEPFKVGVAIADITTGLFAANAILAAVVHRERSGVGQYIDMALLDSQIAWLANVGQNELVGAGTRRWGNAHPSIVPYQTFATADGHIALAVGSDRQFAALCNVLGETGWARDTRFASNPARVTNRDVLVGLLTDVFVTRPLAHWLKSLNDAGVPCAPINSVAEALNDPQVRARGMVQTVSHPTLGALDLLGPVAKLSETPAAIHRPPPTLGADTDAVLAELGYDLDARQRFRAAGVIG